MNILLISQRIPFPPNKGEKIRTYHQIQHLVRMGVNLYVASPIEKHSEISNAESLNVDTNIEVLLHKLPLKLYRYARGLITGKAISISNFYSSQLQVKIDSLIRQVDISTIICTSASLSEYVFRSTALNMQGASRNENPVLLMDFMDIDSDKWLQYANSSSGLLKWVYKREAGLLEKREKAVQEQFDACFFISQLEVDLLSNKLGTNERVFVLENGVDTDAFYPASIPPNNESPVFLFTGVMDYKPNVDAVTWFVNNLWSNIVSRFPGARFNIVGMNPDNSVLALRQVEGIEVTGYVDDILPYYHQADYFLAPFRIARGVQNKILQAFACGLPVISTSIGAEGIKCKDRENLLIADSLQEFLDRIIELEDNELLKTTLGSNALDLIQSNYSWASKLQVLNKFIKCGKINSLGQYNQ